MSNAASSDGSASLRVIGRPWRSGESGNPKGRPPSPIDIAALARVHGPRCIEVAVELLDDPDPRIRLAALVALLDRGFVRPAQASASQDNTTSLQFMHLAAARAFSEQLAAERQAAENGQTTIHANAASPPLSIEELLSRPALE
jgi:hypothetical protein